MQCQLLSVTLMEIASSIFMSVFLALKILQHLVKLQIEKVINHRVFIIIWAILLSLKMD